jgi:hypothetical protein
MFRPLSSEGELSIATIERLRVKQLQKLDKKWQAEIRKRERRYSDKHT